MRKWIVAVVAFGTFLSCRGSAPHVGDARPGHDLVPFAFPDTAAPQGGRRSCGFGELKLPEDIAVFASGAYGGRSTDYQIDQSGHQATRFDIAVNSPGKPVVLILGAYEPSIWNIGWTEGTRIAAVFATGYHRQAVAGLPRETPILVSTYENRGPCGYTYVAESEFPKLNPLSRRLFRKAVDMVYPAKDGKAVVGDPLPAGRTMVTSASTPPESFVDAKMPLAGPAGIRDAVRKGLLRPATGQDIEDWADGMAASQPKDALPPVFGGDNRKALRPRDVHSGYVILKPFRFPAGLYGANSATFFLPRGVPYPEGNPGHSTVYDFNTMTCRGPACGRE